MKITRRQLRQIIKETLDPDLLKGAYVSSKEDRAAMKDYIAKLKAKKKSIDSDGDGTLDADELHDLAGELEAGGGTLAVCGITLAYSALILKTMVCSVG